MPSNGEFNLDSLAASPSSPEDEDASSSRRRIKPQLYNADEHDEQRAIFNEASGELLRERPTNGICLRAEFERLLGPLKQKARGEEIDDRDDYNLTCRCVDARARDGRIDLRAFSAIRCAQASTLIRR